MAVMGKVVTVTLAEELAVPVVEAEEEEEEEDDGVMDPTAALMDASN